MEVRQRLVLDACERSLKFIEEHPATGTLSYESARATLQDAVTKLRELAGTQYSRRQLGRMEARRHADQASVLVDQFIRPVVTIARAQIEPTSDIGLPAGLRMPKLPVNPSQLLTVCDGMIDAARPYEAVLVQAGLPADFLAQFQAARNELARLAGGRTVQKGAHVAARTALPAQFERARRAVERLDAVVRASYRREPGVIAAWRTAKRVQRQATGLRGGQSVETPVTPSESTPTNATAGTTASTIAGTTATEAAPPALSQAA